MEEEERTKVELQQKLTGIQNVEAQLKVSLPKKESECVMDVREFKAWLHLVQNADELKTVKKISRAKGAEVHKLESEYIHVLYSKPKARDIAEPLLHR